MYSTDVWRDTITGFGAGDTFVFQDVDGIEGPIDFIGSDAFTSGGDHTQARLESSTLQIDVDGDGQFGAGDMSIELNSLATTLTSANFLVL